MWDKHNIVALLLAVLAAAWSQLLLGVGDGTIPLPAEYKGLFAVLAAAVTMALTSLTPYFKLPPKQ